MELWIWIAVQPQAETDGSPVEDPEASRLDCIVKRMKVVMRESLHVGGPVNFWLKGVCSLAVSFWLALPTPVYPGPSHEPIPQGRAVASGTSSSDLQHSLLEGIKSELQHKNPRIHHVAVVELRPFPFPEPRKYLMIGWGIRQDRNFEGDFSDELFGFFVLDASLGRIIRVLKIVDSPRWLDYCFHFKKVTADTIIVRGEGCTYGDQPLQFQFSWAP